MVRISYLLYFYKVLLRLLTWLDRALYSPILSIYGLYYSNDLTIFVTENVRKMNRRLLQFLQAENLTQTQFADTLSVARASVSHILSGRNKPGYDFLESLLLHYPSLNLDWLLTGKGRMYRENRQEDGTDSEQLALFPLPSPSEPRRIDRILVFYDDNTYQEFRTKE